MSEITLSSALQSQVKNLTTGELTIVDSNVAILFDTRIEYGSSGGVAYYSVVTCFCGSEKETHEWNWRHRTDPNLDNPKIRVFGIEGVKVLTTERSTRVSLVLINENFGNRPDEFCFRGESNAVEKLSEQEQEVFLKKAKTTVVAVMEGLKELHTHSPLMPTTKGFVNYLEPRVVQVVTEAGVGVSAFVIEEQIDHEGDDRQMRCTLYVFKKGWLKAQAMREDHGYNKSGGALLNILEVKHDSVLINTKNFKWRVSVEK